ncbi:hypothetical protein DPMN_006796 [Dreissena polymorpha]|uniref:Uncharacterized protein n=1 Tax=Dreissena polymorpha TaxID=45954 RepID=A0A9D4MVU7_DREPO|nr:hypothetical protein DPMN_006796 [Dreissena polymorpha]
MPECVDMLLLCADQPSLTKFIKVDIVFIGVLLYCLTSRLAAISLGIASFRHRYLPPVSAVLHADRMCSMFAGLPHNQHVESSVRIQVRRLVGKTSQT